MQKTIRTNSTFGFAKTKANAKKPKELFFPIWIKKH
jgi:hypothetical protein